jgi:hypothetical protein
MTRERINMESWEDVQAKKSQMQKEAVAPLDKAQKEILAKVLELEWENRHLKTPDIRTQLRNFIQQVVKNDPTETGG